MKQLNFEWLESDSPSKTEVKLPPEVGVEIVNLMAISFIIILKEKLNITEKGQKQ